MSAEALSDDLPCQDLVELITEYLEQVLQPAELSRFEEHLETCPGCRAYLQQMRQTIATVRQLRKTTSTPSCAHAC